MAVFGSIIAPTSTHQGMRIFAIGRRALGFAIHPTPGLAGLRVFQLKLRLKFTGDIIGGGDSNTPSVVPALPVTGLLFPRN